MANRRLLKEYSKMTDPEAKGHSKVKDVLTFANIELGSDGDDILTWNIDIKGPEGSAYEGFCIPVQMSFPAQYPFKPPKLVFKTKVHHPNVNKEDGTVCPDAFHLDSKSWGPTLGAAHVLRVVYSSLSEPSMESPLDAAAGTQYRANKDTWKKNVVATLGKYGAKSWVSGKGKSSGGK
eukprot:g3065.t1